MLKLILTTLVLLYASFLDLKYRQIDDSSWVALLLLGFLSFFYDFFRFRDYLIIKMFLVSLLVIIILTLPLYYLKIIGGGDAKILIGISAVFPYYPRIVLSVYPIFTLSVFANAILLAVLASALFFLYNFKFKNFREFLIYKIPFLIPITLGFLLSAFFGDIPSYLVIALQ